jgi:hypothetical protein
MDQLTERQIETGAKYLTASDSGCLARYVTPGKPATEEQMLRAIGLVERDHAAYDLALFSMELNNFSYFTRALRDGDAHYIGELRKNLPWLFDEGGTP